LEVDLPEGGTRLGFGVKFGGEETNAAGQNDRAFPVIIPYIDDKIRCGVAEEAAEPRAGAAVLSVVTLRGAVIGDFTCKASFFDEWTGAPTNKPRHRLQQASRCASDQRAGRGSSTTTGISRPPAFF
jgi:hypothetical protein